MEDKVWIILENEDYIEGAGVIGAFTKEEHARQFYEEAISIYRNGYDLDIQECDISEIYTKPIFCLELSRYSVYVRLYSKYRELEIKLNRKWFKSTIGYISIPLKYIEGVKCEKDVIEKYKIEIEAIKYAVKNGMSEKALRVLIETLFFL